MAYCYDLILPIIYTDKQDLLSVKRHLNKYEYCYIYAADSFGFAVFIVVL
jgi:hypothetical protein